MIDEYELDFNEESDKEYKVLNKKKSADRNVRDLSKSKSKKINEPEKYSQNKATDSNLNSNSYSINKYKYFFIFYDNKNYDLVKDYLYDKTIRINTIDSRNNLENCKNVYFMFVNSERRVINAIMKKECTKYDENKRQGKMKMETKVKLEISFKELIQEYKFSDENLSRLHSESGDTENVLNNDLDLGNGLIMKEIKDEEGIYIFEKIRNAMTKKEDQEKRKQKNKRRERSSSSSESSSRSKQRPERKNSKNTNEGYNKSLPAHNPYLMNYYYQYPPQLYPGMANRPLRGNEQMAYFPYSQFPINPNVKTEAIPCMDMSKTPFYPMNPNLFAVYQQMQYQNAAISQYAMNVRNPIQVKDLNKKQEATKSKKKNSRYTSRSYSKSSLSKSETPSQDKKYFDLKHLDNYNQLDKKTSKSKNDQLNLNDMNVIKLETKTESKLSNHSSSQSDDKILSENKVEDISEKYCNSNSVSDKYNKSEYSLSHESFCKSSKSKEQKKKPYYLVKNKRRRSESFSRSLSSSKVNDLPIENQFYKVNDRRNSGNQYRNQPNDCYYIKKPHYRRESYRKFESYKNDNHHLGQNVNRNYERNNRYEKLKRKNSQDEVDCKSYIKQENYYCDYRDENNRSYNYLNKKDYGNYFSKINQRNIKYNIEYVENKDKLNKDFKSKSRSLSKKKSDILMQPKIDGKTEEEKQNDQSIINSSIPEVKSSLNLIKTGYSSRVKKTFSNFSECPPASSFNPVPITKESEVIKDYYNHKPTRKTNFSNQPFYKGNGNLLKNQQDETNITLENKNYNNTCSIEASSELYNISYFKNDRNSNFFKNNPTPGNNLEIINELGRKKIIINKDRKNPELKVVKREK